MKNEIMNINGVQGYLDESGMAHLNLENVARGLGFVKREVKNNTTYERINKQALKNWFYEFGIQNSENEIPEFIPENIFYKLCFKASNETARKFQDVVTDEILPEIRKNWKIRVATNCVRSGHKHHPRRQIKSIRINCQLSRARY